MSDEVYPKMGTLFRLQPGTDGRRKWFGAVDELLPDTAGLHFIPPENVVVTEKIDGANMWIDVANGEVGRRKGVCDPIAKGDEYYFEAAMPIFAKKNIPDWSALEPYGWPELVLFGELAGPKVQSSGALLDQREFLLFDVLAVHHDQAPASDRLPVSSYLARPHWFRWQAVKDLAAALGIHTVPEYVAGLAAWPLSFEDIAVGVDSAMSLLNPKVEAEGFVIRDGEDTSYHRRRIAKIRRRDFR